jgi:hypothetical protein
MSVAMRPHEIVNTMRIYADASAKAAALPATPSDGRARLNFMATVMLEACECIEQLQNRLVRQACYFEHIEATQEPQWPLFEDDDPGAAI